MKRKILSLLLILIMLITIVPTNVMATEYNGAVTFVGQWVGESNRKIDTTKDFTSAEEK